MGMLQAPIYIRTTSCIINGGAIYKSVPSTCHIFSGRGTKLEDKCDIPRKLICRDSSHRKLTLKASALLTVPPFSQADKAPSKYLFRTERGDQVKICIEKRNRKYSVYIYVSSSQIDVAEDELVLSWGIYRSSSSSFIPLSSDGHSQYTTNKITETPFRLVSAGQYEVRTEVASHFAPFYLSFVLKSPLGSSKSEIKSHRRTNFCVPVGFSPGLPYPLGVSFSSGGATNFAFFSRSTDSVILCLYKDSTAEKPALEIELDPYVNRTGDIWHASLDSASGYMNYGYRIKNKVLLDPYAKVISNSGLAKLSRIPAFDWGGDMPPSLPMEELVVYRLNVLKFTKDKSSKLSPKYAGTFAGVTEKLQHFKSLGVNAVLLEPVFPFDERKGQYYPSHFFSPGKLYGPFGDYISAIVSMKEMVKTMHANRIEVHLEVVFTHNDSESKNALNCNHPVVQQLIIDSLRYWVTEFHIDGFCFVNASNLLRGFHGEYLSRPPLVEAIAFDPILSKTKIVADFRDPQGKISEQTSFPHWKRWAEVNARFSSDVRSFLSGKALLSDLATRLCGSGDVFSSGRGPAFSFNFISHNSGEEGPTDLGMWVRQIRNFFFILYISLGVPVLNMGDEAGQSCDTKPFNWKDLNLSFGVQMTRFVSFLCSFRKRRGDLLQRRKFLDEKSIIWYANDLSPPRWDDVSAKFLAMNLKPVDQETSMTSSRSRGDLYIAFNASDHSENVILPSPPKGMKWARLIDTALAFPGFFSSDGEPIPEQIPGLVTCEVEFHSCVLFEAQKLLG